MAFARDTDIPGSGSATTEMQTSARTDPKDLRLHVSDGAVTAMHITCESTEMTGMDENMGQEKSQENPTPVPHARTDVSIEDDGLVQASPQEIAPEVSPAHKNVEEEDDGVPLRQKSSAASASSSPSNLSSPPASITDRMDVEDKEASRSTAEVGSDEEEHEEEVEREDDSIEEHDPAIGDEITPQQPRSGGPAELDVRSEAGGESISGSDDESDSISTSWSDDDDTEDYDPNRRPKKRARTGKSNHRRANLKAADDAETEQESRAASSSQPGSETTVTHQILCLKISSTEGKERYASLLSTFEAQRLSTEHEKTTAGRSLRTREKHQVIAVNGLDTLPADHDERAKPFARGCKACSAQAVRCSLLDYEKEWPCDACAQVTHDCELHVPPIRKRKCLTCDRQRIPCSYTNTRNHTSDACNQCEKSGNPCCIAGPVKEYIRTRIRMTEDGEPEHPPKAKRRGKARKLDACIECVEAGKSCAYPDEYDGGACDRCRRYQLPCTISEVSVASEPYRGPVPKNDHIPSDNTPTANLSTTSLAKDTTMGITTGLKRSRQKPSQAKSKKGSATKPAKPTSQPPGVTRPQQIQPRVKPVVIPSRKGSLIEIKTSFRHPIDFNSDRDCKEADPSKCNLCTDPPLAALGFGKVKVNVMDWKDGRAYTELGGGHKESGVESTRLCTSCTTERLAIVVCEGHDIVHLGNQPTPEANEEAAMALVDGKVEDMGVYCSLCSNLKRYVCVGCGMSLCELCRVSLMEVHSGDLGQMLAESYDGETNERPLGLRADVEFLKEEGPLMRYQRWLISKDEEEVKETAEMGVEGETKMEE